MEENLNYLPYLFQEDIYFVKSDFKLSENSAQTQPSTLGANQKKIAWIYSLPGNEVCPEPYFTLLSKMVAACKLSLNDVIFVNLALHKEALPDYEKLVLFGKAEQIPLSFNDYQVVNRNLVAHKLEEIINDASLKKKLWEALQNLFL